MTVDEFVRTKVQAEHRQVRMKTLDDVNKPALRYYIKQAVKLDKA